MASRAVANVTISLGLVHVAVKLYLSASAGGISFSMINPVTKNRVSQKLVDKETGEEVNRASLLKGYEYSKDQFVCFTEEEIENLQAAKRDTLEIKEFVPASEINPLHVEKTYYTGPNKGMDKGYMILYRMLQDHNRAAIGTWVSHGKEHLVAIRAYQHGIIIQQLFYDTEVRAFDNMCAAVTISPVELAMGKVLMDALFNEYLDKSKYSDRFIDSVTAAIRTKIEGGTITKPDATQIQSSGMADALRASLLAIGVSESQVESMLTTAKEEASKVKSPKPTVAAKPQRTRRVAKAS